LDVPVDQNLTLAAFASASADAVDVDVGACGCVKNGRALFNLDSFVVRFKNNLEFLLQIAPKASHCVQN
jgi:hypothetical protein